MNMLKIPHNAWCLSATAGKHSSYEMMAMQNFQILGPRRCLRRKIRQLTIRAATGRDG